MRILPCLASFLFFAAAAAGCGSSNVVDDTISGPAATGPAPSACTSAEDCNPEQCVCTDGAQISTGTACFQGTCSVGASDSFCAKSCADHGGVTAIRPAPNVAASAECDAWCSKGAGLTCGSDRCNRFFFCGVSKGSCEAATRAALKCAVEKGTWACSTHSSSWSVSSSCPSFSELCMGGEAGGR